VRVEQRRHPVAVPAGQVGDVDQQRHTGAGDVGGVAQVDLDRRRRRRGLDPLGELGAQRRGDGQIDLAGDR
jgi:hypothetical protein